MGDFFDDFEDDFFAEPPQPETRSVNPTGHHPGAVCKLCKAEGIPQERQNVVNARCGADALGDHAHFTCVRHAPLTWTWYAPDYRG